MLDGPPIQSLSRGLTTTGWSTGTCAVSNLIPWKPFRIRMCMSFLRSRNQGPGAYLRANFRVHLRASRTLSESNSRPAVFFPFLGSSVSSLANRSVPVCKIFDSAVDALEHTILSTEDADEMTAAANAFLLHRIPKPDEKVDQARELVACILNERAILTVEDLAAQTGINVRSLQRLFSQYVGVSPKWVIRRYRLHELLEQMHSGQRLDWAQLAVDLGYFDQAHLINDFKSIVGYTPTEYPGLEPLRV